MREGGGEGITYPVDIVDDVSEEVATISREGGEDGLDFGFGRVGCHGLKNDGKGLYYI